MRGYWKAQQSGDPNAVRNSKNLHFPDTWKTPYDATFSNQSQYAQPSAPHWEGDVLVLTQPKPRTSITVEPNAQSPQAPIVDKPAGRVIAPPPLGLDEA